MSTLTAVTFSIALQWSATPPCAAPPTAPNQCRSRRHLRHRLHQTLALKAVASGAPFLQARQCVGRVAAVPPPSPKSKFGGSSPMPRHAMTDSAPPRLDLNEPVERKSPTLARSIRDGSTQTSGGRRRHPNTPAAAKPPFEERLASLEVTRLKSEIAGMLKQREKERAEAPTKEDLDAALAERDEARQSFRVARRCARRGPAGDGRPRGRSCGRDAVGRRGAETDAAALGRMLAVERPSRRGRSAGSRRSPTHTSGSSSTAPW